MPIRAWFRLKRAERGTRTPSSGGRSYAILSLLHIMNDGWLASLPLLLPFARAELDLDYAKIGFLTSALGMAGIFLSVPAAGLARRIGGFRLLGASALLYSASFLVVASASSFAALLSAFSLASLGFGAFHPIGFSLVASESPSEGLGRRMGGFTAIGDIGRIGVAALVTALIAWLSWRKVAALYAVIPTLVVAALFMAGTFKAEAAQDGRRRETPKGRARRPLNRALLPILAGGFIDSLASSSLFVFIPFLFMSRGASPGLIGSLSGAFFLGNMLGKIALGGVVDRFGGRRVFLLSELAMAGLLVGLGLARSPLLMVPISIVLGAATKGTVPVINTLLAQAAGDEDSVQGAFAVSSTAGGVAGAVSPLLFGLVSEGLGVEKVFLASAVFALLAAIPLLATRPRDAEPRS